MSDTREVYSLDFLPPIHGYRLVRPLGKGSFGMVVLAEKDGEFFAIKISSNQREALNEVEMMRKLPLHRNLIRFIESFSESGNFYIVMEYVEGQSLFEHLKSSFGTLQSHSEPAFFQVLEQMLNAMVSIHAAGIVHRDIKPENFMFEKRTGRVVLLDLGGSSCTGSERSGCVGTPLYVSPEVVREGVDAKDCPSVDMWSIGIFLVLMHTGKCPYPTSSKCEIEQKRLEIMMSVANLTKPPIPKILMEDESPFGVWMRTVATSCLQLDPSLRPTAQQVLDSVKEYQKFLTKSFYNYT